MITFKSVVPAALFAAGALLASPASAMHWRVQGDDGQWTDTYEGIVISGPVAYGTRSGTLPCNLRMEVSLKGGVAAVVAAEFSGPWSCPDIKASNLPWDIAPPVTPFRPENFKSYLVISGIALFFRVPYITCLEGIAVGELEAGQNGGGNPFSFNIGFPRQPATPCNGIQTLESFGKLTTNRVLDFVGG